MRTEDEQNLAYHCLELACRSAEPQAASVVDRASAYFDFVTCPSGVAVAAESRQEDGNDESREGLYGRKFHAIENVLRVKVFGDAERASRLDRKLSEIGAIIQS